jgi:hypothetical protein
MLAAAAAALTVVLSSPTANPDAQVRVTVTGLHAHSALVVLHGGIARQGKWFHWVPLRRTGADAWSAVLKTPGLYGMYPIRVRADGVVRQTDQAVAVVPRGFASQPAFETPEQVAQWWAWLVPSGVAIKSVGTWQSGFYTHRDPTLNRLLRVSFSLLGDWQARHLRRGSHTLYLSVARARPGAPWRLLEAIPSP